MAAHNTTMSLSLPTSLKEYVRQRARQEHYGTPSDFVRGLIRDDLKRAEQERLERMLLDGLTSGASEPMTRGGWQKLRSAVRAQQKKHA